MAWNGSDFANKKSIKGESTEATDNGMKFPIRGLIAGIVVVAGAVAAFFLLNQNCAQLPAKKPTTAEAARIADSKRPVAMPPKAEPKTTAEEPAKPRVLGKTPTGKEYIAMTSETNSTGVITEKYQLTNGKWMQVVQLQTKDSLVFDNDFDLQLAIIGMTPMNRPLPPFPQIKNLEAAFEKAIQTPIIIKDSDNEETKAMKEAALAARQQIADLRREGYTIEQILSEDNSLRQKNIEFRSGFQKELNEIYRNEGAEAAEDYMKSANEKLEKVGIVPLTMPGSGKKKYRKTKE